MKLHCLGTAGYHPNDGRQTTCLMIPELGIIFDAGSAFYRVRELLETDSIDILLSHAHLDHVMGLTFILNVLHEKDVKSIRVHGEEDKLAAIRDHLFHRSLFPVDPLFESVPLSDPILLPGNGKCTHVPLQHPGGSVGYRIDFPGRSLAFITDTTASIDADYVEFIRGVDLLIHECNFMDGQEELAKLTGHSFTSGVASVAKEAEVGRLVLIHMNPLVDAVDPVGLKRAREIFPESQIALDRMIIDF